MNDTIHDQQPEATTADLKGTDAINRIKEIVSKSPNCFFCTAVTAGTFHGNRPMNVRKVDDTGNLWFLSSKESSKNVEVAIDPNVKLYFQGSTHSDFMQLNGMATIVDDKGIIEELWEPLIETWFTEGVTDPRISVIKFVPTDGYYWDTKHGTLVAGAKMLVGMAFGKTMDDSIEGRLLPLQ